MMTENGNQRPATSVGNPTFLVVMNVVNTLTHLCLGGITIGAVMYANSFPGISVFSSLYQHIYLCVIGYVVLMSQAILTMSPYNGWANSFKYQERRTIHWVMQICGSALAIAGSSVRIANVNSHFSTPHGAFGILALIFTILSFIGGVVNLYSTKMGISPKLIKICHACFGSLTLVCAFLCLIFGFNKDIIAAGSTNSGMLSGLTVFALIGTLLPAALTVIKRFNN